MRPGRRRSSMAPQLKAAGGFKDAPSVKGLVLELEILVTPLASTAADAAIADRQQYYIVHLLLMFGVDV